MAQAAPPDPLPVQASAEIWAQCENPSCNKWRLLPPNTVLNESEPWYCHMNPDTKHNACDIPEATYDQAKEIIIDANYEVPKNAKTAKDLNIVVNPQQPRMMPQVKPKAKKRGRPKGAKNHTGVGGDPRQRMVSFADDDDFDMEIGGGGKRGRKPKDDDDDKGSAGHSAKCLVHVLNSMVDRPFVPGKKAGPCVSTQGRKIKAQRQVPIETPSWEALSKMAGDTAGLACEYADVYSSLAMMNGQFDSEQQRSEVIKESSSVEMQLRIAAMFAAAKGLCSISGGMTLQDRTEWDVLDDSGFVPISAYVMDGGGDGGGSMK
jgi:hypothetical protein